MTAPHLAAAMAASFATASNTQQPGQDYTPPVWSYLVGDLRTGRITTELPILSPTFSAPLNDAGTFAGTLNLGDPDVASLNPRLVAGVARTFLAVELNGTIVYGGPIWAHRYSKRTRVLRLAGAGLWSVWDHRKVLPPLGFALPPTELADSVLRGATYRSIASQLIAQAFLHTGGELPVVWSDGTPVGVIPPGGDPGTHDLTVRSFDLSWLGDVLRDLTAREDGPDLELRPRRRADAPEFLEWELRVGTPYLTQAGPAWQLEDTDLVDVTVDVDGTGLASRGWATGEGTQREMLVRYSEDLELVNTGAPLLEAQEDHRTANTASTVQGYADALVGLRSRPVETWDVDVRADAELSPATYAVGDRFTLPVEGDPYIEDGDHLVRCVAIGGNGEHLSLSMQPEQGAL